MACCGGRREKEVEVKAEEKWDYINLQDFRSSSCFKPFSYGILYISLLISISVYAIDTFTAVNLLAFNRWYSQVKPIISLSISRWVFSACIILSWLILIFEWIRAVRVMKRGSVAESYLDPLAVRVQSIRMGKNGQGWRRFLVFTQLTKSKKGTEYIALFTYFSFKAWIRIVLAEGPRQVINALTLYSFIRVNLVPTGADTPKGHSPASQFFINLRVLATDSRTQAMVLAGMAWTLLIWVITALNLLIAVILYLVFLWHHIPVSDGGLTGYLTRKVDAKVRKIVAVKVQKALDKENARKDAEDARELNAGGKKREPTVPTLDGFGSTDELVKYPGVIRQPSELSLPPYPSSSHSSLDRKQQPPMPTDPWAHPAYPPSRTNTPASTSTAAPSYRSVTPNTVGMPYGPPPQQGAFTQSPIDMNARYDVDDPGTYNYPPRNGPPRRAMTPMGPSHLPPSRQQTPTHPTAYARGPPGPGLDPNDRQSPPPRGGPAVLDPYGRSSPAPYTRQSPAPRDPYGRGRMPPPRRNMTAPLPPQPQDLYFPPQPTPRSNTVPPQQMDGVYEDLEMQDRRGRGRGRGSF
ncbi:hypothetical protein FGG08_006851 [Glutinoglossum americanum]|uniref:Vacuolar membrane protein n=1 Tax=Glutinoglossum americanum TaxID=1670608 RepID=A0A9P8L1H7_9PEZI|nr:hypothetical protein FGG08_006851 [Glutinoglossum americanum]